MKINAQNIEGNGSVVVTKEYEATDSTETEIVSTSNPVKVVEVGRQDTLTRTNLTEAVDDQIIIQTDATPRYSKSRKSP